MNSDFYYLGLITKPFGFKGQLFIYLDTDQPEKYQTLDAVFVNVDGEMIPYIIEEFIYKNNNTAIVKFKDIDPQEARSLIKSELYLPLEMLPPLTGNQFYFHEVIGFKVIDKEKGDIGICREFIEISRQPIMQIEYGDKEILIPAVDEYLDKVDREKRILYINAPEGLIDIYIG